MNIIECCKAYNASAELLANGVTGHSVLFKELADFNSARITFAKELKSALLQDTMWEDGRKLLAEIHAKLARSPYRPSWLMRELLEKKGKSRILSELKSRLPNVDQSIRNLFEHVLSTLDQLRRVEINPLCLEIANSRLALDGVVFVLEEMQFVEEARSCLADVVDGDQWEMVRPPALRGMRKANRVVIFSPAWWLKYRNDEYLLRSPIIGDTRLLACRHEFGGAVSFSLLDNATCVNVTGVQCHPDLDAHASYEALPPRRESRFRLKASDESPDLHSGKTIIAIPFKFGGGRGTYFPPESSVWVAHTEFINGRHVCLGVEHIVAESLEPGDLVLMTKRGGGDMIPVVADMILGKEAPKLRETQLRWKAALRTLVSTSGIKVVAAQLRRLGAKKATPTNLRNWSNERNIGMEDLGADLCALLQLVGMESDLENVTDAIEKLRTAHKSAGHQRQRKLLASLSGKDLSGVFEKGWLEVVGDEGATKTVFLVEERGSEQEIPAEWEGEIRDVDE